MKSLKQFILWVVFDIVIFFPLYTFKPIHVGKDPSQYSVFANIYLGSLLFFLFICWQVVKNKIVDWFLGDGK